MLKFSILSFFLQICIIFVLWDVNFCCCKDINKNDLQNQMTIEFVDRNDNNLVDDKKMQQRNYENDNNFAAAADDDVEDDENKLIRANLLMMEKIMNKNLNPCDNFIEYACNNYIKNTYDVGIFPNIADNRYIEIAFNTDDSFLFESARKAKQFYLSCLKRDNLRDAFKKVNVLKSIGKWPITNNDDSYDKLSWMRISEELKLIDLDPVLEITYDDFNMIEIYYNGRSDSINLQQLNESDIEDMKKILIMDFDTSIEDTQKIIEDILNFTKSRKEIFENFDDCLKKDERWRLNYYYDLKTFKNEFPSIDWDNYLKLVFNREITDSEPIKLRRHQTTKPYIELISRTNPKTIINYVVWVLIKGLQKLGTIEDSCSAKTFGQFESVLTAIYSKILFNTNDRRRYLDILNRFEKGFEYSKQHYNVTHQRNLLYVLTKERRYINILDSVFSIKELNDDFENVTIDSENYYQNLINLGQQRKCNLIKRECMDRLDLMMFIFEVASMHDKPIYFSFSNKYYFLWESVIQHCFTRRRLNTTQYEDTKKCILNQRMEWMNINNSNIGSNNELLNHRESEKSVIITSALKQTFEDYERWLQQNEDKLASNEIFKEFNLNNRKAFFLNFVQGYCDQNEQVKYTIEQSLMNLDEFSNVFECTKDSRMNLQNKCKIR